MKFLVIWISGFFVSDSIIKKKNISDVLGGIKYEETDDLQVIQIPETEPDLSQSSDIDLQQEIPVSEDIEINKITTVATEQEIISKLEQVDDENATPTTPTVTVSSETLEAPKYRNLVEAVVEENTTTSQSKGIIFLYTYYFT